LIECNKFYCSSETCVDKTRFRKIILHLLKLGFAHEAYYYKNAGISLLTKSIMDAKAIFMVVHASCQMPYMPVIG
jgi:hypothetical protein